MKSHQRLGGIDVMIGPGLWPTPVIRYRRKERFGLAIRRVVFELREMMRPTAL